MNSNKINQFTINKSSFLSLLVYALPVVFALLVYVFLPNHPIKDERLFLIDVVGFENNGLAYTSLMKGAHGPLFLYFLSLFRYLFCINGMLGLRVVNMLIAIGIILLSFQWVKLLQLPKSTPFTLIYNPYFWGLCSVLIYSDNSVLFLSIAAFLFFYKEKNLRAAFCLIIAVLIRQTAVLALFPLLLTYLWFYEKKTILHVLFYLLPLGALSGLIYLWSGSLMSPNVVKAYQFYRTVGGFNFEIVYVLKSFFYQVFLLGLLGFLFLDFSINRKRLFSLLGLIVLVFYVNPIQINLRYQQLLPVMRNGGYLDKGIQLLLPFSFFIMAFVINSFLWTLWEGRKNLMTNKLNLALFLFVIVNIGFYCISSFWDKYYMIMGLFIPTLLYRIKGGAAKFM